MWAVWQRQFQIARSWSASKIDYIDSGAIIFNLPLQVDYYDKRTIMFNKKRAGVGGVWNDVRVAGVREFAAMPIAIPPPH